jgi:hypothetical protein
MNQNIIQFLEEPLGPIGNDGLPRFNSLQLHVWFHALSDNMNSYLAILHDKNFNQEEKSEFLHDIIRNLDTLYNISGEEEWINLDILHNAVASVAGEEGEERDADAYDLGYLVDDEGPLQRTIPQQMRDARIRHTARFYNAIYEIVKNDALLHLAAGPKKRPKKKRTRCKRRKKTTSY